MRSLVKLLACAALSAALCAGSARAQLQVNQAVAVDATTDRIYVLDDAGSILSSASVSATFGSSSVDVVVTEDGTKALVTLFTPQRLNVFDLTTSPPTLTADIPMTLGASDIDLACTATGFALITDGAFAGRVLSVDVNSPVPVIVSTLNLPVGASAVDVTPDGSLALVTGLFTNTVRVVLVSPTGVLTDSGVTLGASTAPINVAISPRGRTALVARFQVGGVAVLSISGATVSHVDSISLPANPQSIAFTPDGANAYVFHADGTVSVLAIDALDNVTDTGTRISTARAASSLPGVDYLAVTPDGRSLFVRSTGLFRVVDVPGHFVKAGPTALGSGPGGVATRCVHGFNGPPSAVAGPDQTRQCTSPSGATVTLNATGSADPDLDPLSFQWSVPAGIALDDPTSPTPTGVFPIGSTTATVTVTDGRGGMDVDSVTITVVDRMPPDVECSLDTTALWPPDHNMVNVTVTVEASDTCATPGQLALVSARVSSDEPDDANGLGDGSTAGDTVNLDGFTSPVDATLAFAYDAGTQQYRATIPLRAERDGNGSSGRTYTIQATVADPFGNASTASCVVVVPKNQGGGNN